MRRQGNPIICPHCNERIPRIAKVIQTHFHDAHDILMTQAEIHRLASPKYSAAKDRPQVGGDVMDYVVPGGGFETNRSKH